MAKFFHQSAHCRYCYCDRHRDWRPRGDGQATHRSTTRHRPPADQRRGAYVEVDQDRVLKQGLQFGQVFQTLQAFLGGVYVNQFNRFKRQWKVYLQEESEYRTSSDKINNFFVRNSKGDVTPLASLVSIKRVSGPEYTNRFNLFRCIQINGSPAPGYSSGQAMAAMEQVAKEVLPADFGYVRPRPSFPEMTCRSRHQGMVFGLSLLLVFLILAAQYESWSLPFSVLCHHLWRSWERTAACCCANSTTICSLRLGL